ncbi:hypothetical protein QR685DRAFT_544925 [Neurospora intermedia]|uniref:Uncharacterized protein n=1 Tax=Neurospora intermedia TaxID=5142 RepID=A0ABR3D9K9_NEUIN
MEIPTKEEAEAILINETFYDKLISVTDLKSSKLIILFQPISRAAEDRKRTKLYTLFTAIPPLPYDPSLKYRTVNTPKREVTFVNIAKQGIEGHPRTIGGGNNTQRQPNRIQPRIRVRTGANPLNNNDLSDNELSNNGNRNRQPSAPPPPSLLLSSPKIPQGYTPVGPLGIVPRKKKLTKTILLTNSTTVRKIENKTLRTILKL